MKEHWLAVYNAFDPLIPAGLDEGPATVRVERPYTPLGDLQRDLAFPAGRQRALIVGAPGAGKTTELLALMHAQRSLRPVFLDLREHFQDQRGDVGALDRLQPWEVLVVVGLGLYRYGRETLAHPWPASTTKAFAEAIAEASNADAAHVDVAGLAGEVAVLVAEAAAPGAKLALKSLKAAAKHFSATVPLGLRRSHEAMLSDQDNRVQALLSAVQTLVLELQRAYGDKLLLLVDGVDRASVETARRLYEDSELLTRLPCHQIMTAPLGLGKRSLRGWSPHFLGNVPVLEPAAPLRPAAHVAFFCTLWRARANEVNAPTSLVNDALIERLGWASGGLVRVFCEMVQDLAKLAWNEDTPAREDQVERVIDAWRRRWEEDLTNRDVAALRVVQATHALEGTDVEQALLQTRCIVAWPNHSRWYYPHPLLLLKLVRPATPDG